MSSAGWIDRALALRSQSNPIAIGVLVAVNLVPLFGVLFLGWDVGLILISYWLENGIIGLLNIPKILLAGRDNSVAASVIAGFFALHYGGFWIGHGVFVFILAGLAQRGLFGFFGGSGFGAFAFDPIGNVIRDPAILLLALLLLISHVVSFFTNYLGRREYLNTTPYRQMFQPYSRLVVLHVTILFGAFAIVFLGQPIVLVALLVGLKAALDLWLHLREHSRAEQPATVV